MRTKRLVHLVAALVGVAGCGLGSEDQTFGLQSIHRVDIHVRHGEELNVHLLVLLTPSETSTCPPVNPDFKITANDVAPTRFWLDPNEGHSITFGNCRAHVLYADFALPETTRSLRLVFMQDGDGGVIELTVPEQSKVQFRSLSPTSVPVGGAFSVDLSLTPAPAGRIQGGACWYGRLCPGGHLDCVPGEGYSGLAITETQPDDATIRLQARVPEGSPTGARAMTVGLLSKFFGCADVPLPIDRQSVSFPALATVDVDAQQEIGPIAIEVTELNPQP